MTIGVDVAQLFAQSLEPSGKRGLVVLRLLAITFFACVVGHAFDTRVGFGKITTISAPKVARTILDLVYTSQELRLRRHPCVRAPSRLVERPIFLPRQGGGGFFCGV